MKKSFKQRVSTLLLLGLILGAFVGCSEGGVDNEQNSSDTSDAEETTPFTFPSEWGDESWQLPILPEDPSDDDLSEGALDGLYNKDLSSSPITIATVSESTVSPMNDTGESSTFALAIARNDVEKNTILHNSKST